jgi:hypothetical protein
LECSQNGSYNITQKDGIFFVKIDTKDGKVEKPVSECTAEEMKDNNIVERDGDLYIRIVNKKETIKPIEECSDDEKMKN